MAKCLCEDSAGHICNKEMTKEEFDQDGMCYNCADNLFNEMMSKDEYKWYQQESENES